MRSSLSQSAVLPVLLLAATGVCGAARDGDPPKITTPPSMQDACPVSLDVRRSDVAQQMVQTDDSGLTRAVKQDLEFTIQNIGLKSVAAIDGVLQMQSGKQRALLLAPDAADAGERIPIHLAHVIAGGKDALLVQTVANRNPVKYFELDQVRFKDGSQWTRTQATLRTVCRFVPNPLVPVAAR